MELSVFSMSYSSLLHERNLLFKKDKEREGGGGRGGRVEETGHEAETLTHSGIP